MRCLTTDPLHHRPACGSCSSQAGLDQHACMHAHSQAVRNETPAEVRSALHQVWNSVHVRSQNCSLTHQDSSVLNGDTLQRGMLLIFHLCSLYTASSGVNCRGSTALFATSCLGPSAAVAAAACAHGSKSDQASNHPLHMSIACKRCAADCTHERAHCICGQPPRLVRQIRALALACARCASSRRCRKGGSGKPLPWCPLSRSCPYRLSTT